MDLENTPRKQLNELEITVTALLAMMRKAKIQDEALINMLKSFEKELAAIRHKRFDASNSEYRGY